MMMMMMGKFLRIKILFHGPLVLIGLRSAGLIYPVTEQDIPVLLLQTTLIVLWQLKL